MFCVAHFVDYSQGMNYILLCKYTDIEAQAVVWVGFLEDDKAYAGMGSLMTFFILNQCFNLYILHSQSIL